VAAGRGQGAYAPGCQQRAEPKGGAVIFATRNIQKFCELCRGRDGHRRTNHANRTMHILDVISVSRSSNASKSLAAGPGPTGEAYRAPQTPVAGFKVAYFKDPTSKERGGEEKGGERVRQNDLCPGHQKPSRRHWCQSV